MQQSKENISTGKSRCEEDAVTHEQIRKILEEAGIQNYDPQVVTHLADYMTNYTTDILNHAITFATHAERETVNETDVKLALEMVEKKSPSKRLSQKELIELAREHNQTQLPECSFIKRLPLPNEGSILTNCNYKLKSAAPQYPLYSSIPLMDMTNRQNQIVTLNTTKYHTRSIPTVIRTSSGTMSVNVPLNLTPQRIILKPQTPIPSNIISQNKIEHVRKRKLEETKK
ncbi:hypothetical protein ILUMI_00440 [Ignelater luminosus]|uniref:Transcription initiation factor TFIID subunit 9B n=1 Tax=Ignelater luminosus TaxID=2038154 RepID=A0A8K0GL80_IGNLU|nr:hypothetical protein ILUMI_00440 [Ignelater luminosus]